MKKYLPLKIATIFCVALFLLPTLLRAQEVDVSEEYANDPIAVRLAGININGFYPQATFKRNLGDEKGLGVGIFSLYQTAPLSPHFLGFNIEYSHLTHDESFAGGLEERINSGYINIDFQWRIFPNIQLGPLEPYFDAFVGPNFLFTATNFVDSNTGENFDFSFDNTAFGIEYGLGIGIAVHVGNSWFIDASFSRKQTSIAEYLILPDPNSNFSRVNSATDHNKFKFGVIKAF